MKFIERMCWTFYGLCALIELHWLIAKLFRSYGWQNPLHGDFATWLGAIGAIGAFIGTIYIANTETRRRRREQKDLAVVTAASLGMALERAIAATDDVIAKLTDEFTIGYSATPYGACALRLDQIALWSVAELAPLVILPNHTAAKLAAAGALIRHCYSAMFAAPGNSKVQSDQDAFNAEMVVLLQEARSSIQSAYAEFQALLLSVSTN